jgi:hypothetical protein
MPFVRWYIRITELYLAEMEIPRTAVEEIFAGVGEVDQPVRHSSDWAAPYCFLFLAMTVVAQG